MRSLVMAITAIVLSVSASYAASNNKISKEPFVVNFEKLSDYLQLDYYQMNEVQDINNYFIEMQKKSLSAKPERQGDKMHQAVYGNLKLMKKVLDEDQYRKYVTLINITNNNNRIMSNNSLLSDR